MSANILLNLLNKLGKRDKIYKPLVVDFITWRYFTPRRNLIPHMIKYTIWGSIWDFGTYSMGQKQGLRWLVWK